MFIGDIIAESSLEINEAALNACVTHANPRRLEIETMMDYIERRKSVFGIAEYTCKIAKATVSEVAAKKAEGKESHFESHQ